MLAKGYVLNGATVFIISRKLATCEATAKELSACGPGKCSAIAADLSTVQGCEYVCAELTRSHNISHVDVLVNNSGSSWGEPLEKFPEKGWDKVMDLNVKGVFFLIQKMLPLLKKNANSASPSRIINLGSIAGIHHQLVPTFSYDASKAAVHQLTKHLAMFLAPFHITVNAIAPGYVPTDMSKGLETYTTKASMIKMIPLKRMGSEQDMVGAALFLSSKASAWMTGVIMPVDGGHLIKGSL